VLANILLEFLHCFWNVTKAWDADVCRVVCLKFSVVLTYLSLRACQDLSWQLITAIGDEVDVLTCCE
jgi:hypothetical protein